MITGLRVAQIRVLFKIPDEFNNHLFGPDTEPPGHLAYVEWFSTPTEKHASSQMFKVKRSIADTGARQVSVIEVACLHRTCHLFPNFGKRANRLWTSSTVLEQCSDFYINNHVNMLSFQSIY